MLLLLLICVCMTGALLRHRQEEAKGLPANEQEHYLDEEWRIILADGTELTGASLPYTGRLRSDEIVLFKSGLPEESAGMTLQFFSSNADVSVFLGDEIIYRQEQDGESAGTDHFVDIPYIMQDGELCIALAACDQNAETVLGEIEVETAGTVMIGMAGSNFADIVCFLLIVIAAVILFVIALLRKCTGQDSRGELFLGLAGLLAGTGYFIDSGILSIFYNIQEAYAAHHYLMLLFPLLLALYVERNQGKTYPRRFALLLCLAIGNAGIQMALQMTGLWNMEEATELSAAVVCIICATALVSLLQSDSRKTGYRIWLPAVSLLALFAGQSAYIMLRLFFTSAYGSVGGQYGAAVFCVTMAVMHILQITQEYRADAEKRMRIAEEQNRLLAQAKEDADAARQEALAANEAKGKFLAHMSHEIRTPINAVLGMDEMILRESTEENIKEYAMDIHTAGQTLLSLVNDILDFSKIESGKMEIVPVVYDISSLIHDLVNMTSQRAADKNINLVVEVEREIPCRLYGDDVRLRQILTNILTNAVKYTHEGTVWLRVQSDNAEERTMLRFEVEDTGIGIREQDLWKLSAEFERIEEERNRNIEGTGLGMSITMQLLTLLGSKLQVESVYGEGSKFWFELEQKIIDPAPVGNFESRVYQSMKAHCHHTGFCAPDARILVADDNAVNRKVLRNLLKETRIQITHADGGEACLRLVQENHYDLIFLDHMMPGMDGVETLHRIKSLPVCACRDTPIVVLTANAVSGAKENYLSAGFDDFLSKPIVPQKLESMIRKRLPEKLLRHYEEEADVRPDEAVQTDGAETMPEELPAVEGLDWNYAWLHLPDAELLRHTVRAFYDQIESAAGHLEQAYMRIGEPDFAKRYRIQVHAMKSLAATVGIVPLAGVAGVLENAAKNSKIDIITSMTTAFLEEWRSYRQKLQGVFGIEEAAGEEVTDRSVILALVEMVRINMQEMEIDRADQAVAELRAYAYPEEVAENIRKFAEAVTNLDLEETDRTAALLTEQMAAGRG